ncbi:hypothetical protein [Pseudomonas chlororaphis]|uniref:hypothetical protein n=1 Tax=Pseudomonas chlororaphis TaxID=587753 RepID=UPI0039DF8B70
MREKLEYSLQAIRVPSGWTITINNLFEVELTEKTSGWYGSSVLIGGARRSTGHCFDARLEPEADPSGDFVVDFLTIRYDKNGNPIKNSEEHICEFRTKSKTELITKIENYMLEI